MFKVIRRYRLKRILQGVQCKNCGAKVEGLRNHCPKCLWSRHITHVGRGCGGMMKPVGLVLKERSCMIRHQCTKCGDVLSHRSSIHDKFEALAQLMLHDVELHPSTGANLTDNHGSAAGSEGALTPLRAQIKSEYLDPHSGSSKPHLAA